MNKINTSRCTEKGGGSNLVSLHSEAENEFVAGLLPVVGAFTCFEQEHARRFNVNYTNSQNFFGYFFKNLIGWYKQSVSKLFYF